MTAHELVRNRLKALDLGQVELAAKLGVSQSQVSSALNGKNITTLNRLVEMLVEEYGDARATYFPSDNSRLDRLESEMKRLNETLQQVKESHEDLKGEIGRLVRHVIKYK